MKSILILSALAAVAYGRPEAPLPASGYQYNAPPSNSYDAPSGPGDLGQGGFRSSGAPSGGNLGGGFNGQSAAAHTSASASASGHSASPGSILVHKHVYVHVAPPDVEEKAQAKAKVHVPPPQKHYKIIFIKAPTAPTPTVPDIPPIQADEEKTLVYVLVKKPEEQPEIQIPTAAPTEPSKPEVYFIKYKTKKEEQGIHGGAGQDFSQIDNNLDDTVEVGARRQQNSAHAGFSLGAAARAGASQAAPAHAAAPHPEAPAHAGVPHPAAAHAGAPHPAAAHAGAPHPAPAHAEAPHPASAHAGASASAFSFSSASAGSFGGPSSQYGAPAARNGPY